MEQYTKQLNRISKAINEIPYEHIYVEIQTATDKFILDKNIIDSIISLSEDSSKIMKKGISKQFFRIRIFRAHFVQYVHTG